MAQEISPSSIVSVIRSTPRASERKDGPIHVTPPFTLRQGFVSERITQLSSKSEWSKQFLTNLRRVQDNELPLVTLFHTNDVVANIAEANHLRQHWFPEEWSGPAAPYWPGQLVKKVMVDGLVQAFNAAIRSECPILCFWLVYGTTYDPKSPVSAIVDDKPEKPNPGLFMIVTPPPKE